MHHEPESDAEAAGRLWMVLSQVARMRHSDLLDHHGYRLGYFHTQDYLPFSNASQTTFRRQEKRQYIADPAAAADGRLFGKRVALTGTLACMTRHEAFQVVADAGGSPSEHVTRKTEFLVVGSTNVAVVGPSGMSRKHRQAHDLQQKGYPIRIVDEDDLLCLLANEAV